MNVRSAKVVVLLLLLASSLGLRAEQAPPGAEWTPPRLSFVDGQASFWRTGAEHWVPARVNTPLVPGDALYTGERANLEIQVGQRAFVRAAERTQLGLANLEPDFLQLELKGGIASLDLRSLPPGFGVELDTPNAVFTIEHPGYYRAEVRGEATHFITRRGGRATISVEGAPPQGVSSSEEIIVRGSGAPALETYVAPQLDPWDRWNYARTDHEIEALSARYVSPAVYGVGVLDQHGTWRVVPSYGPVWVPAGLAPGWAPYSTGTWIWDPHFGWTWIDDAPWGWAPFHHGRWVVIDGYWAWAPGPIIARPVYAPALVAFFGLAPGVSINIGIAGPALSWVALGWGEPLRPWWGRPGFRGAPWWGGWGGPRVVNNVVIERHTVVNVNTIVYRNTQVPRAVLAVDEKHFGAGPVRAARFTPRAPQELQPVHEIRVRPGSSSFGGPADRAIGPPAAVASRSVLATRAARDVPARAPAPRLVAPPKQPDTAAALPRPSFGQKGPERARPAQPPRYEELRRAPERAPSAAQRGAPERGAPSAAERRALPGHPANVSPRRPDNPGAQGKKGAPASAQGGKK